MTRWANSAGTEKISCARIKASRKEPKRRTITGLLFLRKQSWGKCCKGEIFDPAPQRNIKILRFLRLAAEKGRHVEIVGGDLVVLLGYVAGDLLNHFADVARDLLDDVGRTLRRGGLLVHLLIDDRFLLRFGFAGGLPGFGQV